MYTVPLWGGGRNSAIRFCQGGMSLHAETPLVVVARSLDRGNPGSQHRPHVGRPVKIFVVHGYGIVVAEGRVVDGGLERERVPYAQRSCAEGEVAEERAGRDRQRDAALPDLNPRVRAGHARATVDVNRPACAARRARESRESRI